MQQSLSLNFGLDMGMIALKQPARPISHQLETVQQQQQQRQQHPWWLYADATVNAAFLTWHRPYYLHQCILIFLTCHGIYPNLDHTALVQTINTLPQTQQQQ